MGKINQLSLLALFLLTACSSGNIFLKNESTPKTVELPFDVSINKFMSLLNRNGFNVFKYEGQYDGVGTAFGEKALVYVTPDEDRKVKTVRLDFGGYSEEKDIVRTRYNEIVTLFKNDEKFVGITDISLLPDDENISNATKNTNDKGYKVSFILKENADKSHDLNGMEPDVDIYIQRLNTVYTVSIKYYDRLIFRR